MQETSRTMGTPGGHCAGNYACGTDSFWPWKKSKQKERRPPTKSLEVRGLKEECFCDGTPLTCPPLLFVRSQYQLGGWARPAASKVLGIDRKCESVGVFGLGLARTLCKIFFKLRFLGGHVCVKLQELTDWNWLYGFIIKSRVKV